MLLTTIIIISLFCNGLYVITGERMILEKFDLWLQLTLPEIIYKPLLGCIKCMASIWGTVICFILLPFDLNLIYLIPIACVSASALNAILYEFYE